MTKRAFTIIELLVVVSIIAILIGILVPAIGKARDRALITQSMNNLRQLVTAHATYGADHNDNQWTPTPHSLMQYATQHGQANVTAAIVNYNKSFGENTAPWSQQHGITHCTGSVPCLEIGYGKGHTGGMGPWWWTSAAQTYDMILPIAFETGFGYFGTWNVKSFNQYVTGRFYDALFFAPKDFWVIEDLGFCYDAPGEFCGQTSNGSVFRPSYRLSPAALYSPDLLSQEQVTFQSMYSMPGLLRVPNFSQARYPDLKTHKIEQRWLQNRRRDCSPQSPPFQTKYGGSSPSDGCWPYFFNLAEESVPVTAFYDGHVGTLSVREALDANAQAIASGGENASLWHHKTPGFPGGSGADGYFHTFAYSSPGAAEPFGKSAGNPGTSYHILTRDGILGRDTLGQ